MSKQLYTIIKQPILNRFKVKMLISSVICWGQLYALGFLATSRSQKIQKIDRIN